MKILGEIKKLATKHYRNNGSGSGQYTEGLQEGRLIGYIDGYIQCQNDILQDQTVTRFEVIDENGRVYSKWNCKIELSYQDEGRTLKVFIKAK